MAVLLVVLLLLAVQGMRAALLLSEDFSCETMGCNATHGIFYLKTREERESHRCKSKTVAWRGHPIQKALATCNPLVRARVCAMELMR